MRTQNSIVWCFFLFLLILCLAQWGTSKSGIGFQIIAGHLSASTKVTVAACLVPTAQTVLHNCLFHDFRILARHHVSLPVSRVQLFLFWRYIMHWIRPVWHYEHARELGAFVLNAASNAAVVHLPAENYFHGHSRRWMPQAPRDLFALMLWCDYSTCSPSPPFPSRHDAGYVSMDVLSSTGLDSL